MRLWLEGAWEKIQESFWFLPTLLVAGAIALSLAMIQLDRATSGRNAVAALGWTFTRGPEGSRAVLSTVAGSMMTIASVTFSITIVALQLASSQFGPRLLRNFIRDRGNQVSIGTFIATFTYCLLVLRTVNGTQGQQFVPHIAVTVGLVLALISLGVFIYFVHHAATSIQVENVIAGVSRDLHRAIERLYPGITDREPPGPSSDAELPRGFEEDSSPIGAPQSDYLQAIDLDALVAVACEHDALIALSGRPGQFFFRGGELARVGLAGRLDDELAEAVRGCFYFGPRRSLNQDVEFAVDQLVEVAVRALSPGINDPFTAINCVDRLGAALCALAARSIPSPYRFDDEGRLRVVADASTVAGIVDASFNQIRQAARLDASVTLRLLETVAAVARHTDDPDFRDALRRQADAIHRGSQSGLDDPMDRSAADLRHRQAIASLDRPADADREDYP